MNILLAVPWDQRTGGVTHVVATLAHSLEARGHRALFLFPAEVGLRVRARTSLRGFPSLYCRLRCFPPERPTWRARFSWFSTVLTTLPQLVRHSSSRGIDLINVHYPGEGSALMVDLARSLRVPLVVSAHGSDLLPDAGPNRGTGLRRQLESAAAVVVPSQGYLGSVAQAFPWLRDKMHCIRNGYDEAELSAARAAPANSSQPDLTALCIAALIPKKGIDVLLRGLSECRSARLKVRLIGEGSLRQELESLSAALGLSDRVSFLGPKDRDGVLDELIRCDLMVMPSRHPSESFGLAALEAMACAKPVVASAVGGLPELVGDGETGLLVPPEDPAALARALDLLVDDPAMRTRLGAAGRIRAAQLTVRATADAYQALYADLVRRQEDLRRGACLRPGS